MEVEDPQTIRYVGASYVNLAGLSLDYCRVMLKNQVCGFPVVTSGMMQLSELNYFT